MLRIPFRMQLVNSEAKRFLFFFFPSPSAVSSACGWTETSTTAGVTPVRHSGTPCSQKRRISSCRTSKSGLLSSKAMQRWGQKRVLPKGKWGGVLVLLEQWLRPKPDSTSPELPRPEASYRMLVLYYCSYYTAFFFVLFCFFWWKTTFCVFLVTALSGVLGRHVCKAPKISELRLRQREEEGEPSRIQDGNGMMSRRAAT